MVKLDFREEVGSAVHLLDAHPFLSARRSSGSRRKKTIRRTVLRSRSGRKLYAVRRKGKFDDIQSFKKAHGEDIKRRAKGEQN